MAIDTEEVFQYMQTYDFIMIACAVGIFIFTIILVCCVCCRFRRNQQATLSLEPTGPTKSAVRQAVRGDAAKMNAFNAARIYDDIEECQAPDQNVYLDLHDSTYISPGPVPCGPKPTEGYIEFDPAPPSPPPPPPIPPPRPYPPPPPPLSTEDDIPTDDEEDQTFDEFETGDHCIDMREVVEQLEVSKEDIDRNRLTQVSEVDEMEIKFVIKNVRKTKSKRSKPLT